ncbi:hypothetical protein BOX15_Mlig003840g1 [Macrostomum lignano]|uniref:DZF domain-containing protein n=2 Tax=Macrostomum lignano TaxID=282301 RepID=A0A267DS70_9PLAT|nr:hypothetical protein BOX15_Mlig003840g1 [Macrostomum lignano]
MSGYFGYPTAATGFSVPTQAAMGSNASYPMMAPAMQQAQQPAVAPPAAPYIPTAYPGVYSAAVPVQPMAFSMAPQQQQAISPVFQQPTAYPAMPSLPQQPPPLPSQQQVAWQTVQPASLAPNMASYQPAVPAAMQQPHQFQPPRLSQQNQAAIRPPLKQQQIRPNQNQQQQIRSNQNQQQQQIRPNQNQQQQQIRPNQNQQQQQIRPNQNQQQQQIRPNQNQQQQQIRPNQNQQQQIRSNQNQQQQQIRPNQNQQQQQIRPNQNQQQRPLRGQQQQFQRPQLRPRVPTVGAQRAAAPPLLSAQPRPPVPRPGSAASSLGLGRMRPPAQQKQQPPPLFGKPNLRTVVSAGTAAAAPGQKAATAAASKAGNNSDELPHCPPIPGAVGTEYVVQIRTEQRGAAALQYHCRLCNCRFIDVQARDLHVKGRRHRMQYKRKVDPRISVDAKPGVKARPGGLGTQDSVAAATAAVPSETAIEAANRRRREEEQRLRHMQELEWSNFIGCKPGGMWGGGVGQPRRSETSDDRQVLAKHSSVYPTEAELQAVQQLVTRCERALKLASDHLSSESDAQPPLRGVMRVGALAKGLLLHGDLATQLVLLCATWPSRELRNRVVKLLPERLATSPDGPAESSTDEPRPDPPQLQVRLDEDEDCISVHQLAAEDGGLELTCSIYLTSPAVREEAGADSTEPEDDQLDRDKCLEALAALRQAKWFQAKASSLQSCVPVIRVMRDMCQRLPVWAPLPNWAVELLVERCISSAGGGQLVSPGEAIRRVMECLASGVLLPAGPGLRDPCEKLPVDAAASMTAQEREDVTASAQQALRLIAFRQLHRVLDMPPLAAPAAPAAAKRPAVTAASAASGAKQQRVE